MNYGAYTEASENGLWSMDRWQTYSITWRERDGEQTAKEKARTSLLEKRCCGPHLQNTRLEIVSCTL